VWDPRIYLGSEIRHYLPRKELPDSVQQETLQVQAGIAGYSNEGGNTSIHVMGGGFHRLKGVI